MSTRKNNDPASFRAVDKVDKAQRRALQLPDLGKVGLIETVKVKVQRKEKRRHNVTKDDNRPNKISFWILVLVSSYGGAGVQVLKAGLRIGSESLKTRLRQFRGIDEPAR